jgi:hypothetical protein
MLSASSSSSEIMSFNSTKDISSLSSSSAKLWETSAILASFFSLH